mgnify:CR=1 FL=1
MLWLREAVRDREPTIRDLAELRSRSGRVVGTPEQIADRLSEWRDAGVGGINVVNSTIPGSYLEFAEYILPVLRDRGLAQTEYAEGTSRKKLRGTDRLPESHPAAAYRNAFSEVTV